MTTSSLNRPALPLAARLYGLLVGRDDIGGGVDGREAQRPVATVAHLVRDAFGHERDAAGGYLVALLAHRDVGDAVGDHDDLLGAVSVPREPAADRHLEERAARGAGTVGGTVGRGRA